MKDLRHMIDPVSLPERLSRSLGPLTKMGNFFDANGQDSLRT
jgi:hypothetical protein